LSTEFEDISKWNCKKKENIHRIDKTLNDLVGIWQNTLYLEKGIKRRL